MRRSPRSSSAEGPGGLGPFGALLCVAACALASLGCAARAAGCKTDLDCPRLQLCLEGACKETMCTADWNPVCGEDGKTYSNSCHARLAHVATRGTGECGGAPPSEGARVCGGIQGLRCAEGEFCDLPAGMCRGADLQGTCVPQREACTKERRPVCGCDGTSYANDCERIKAGVQKDHDGECQSSPSS